MCEPWRAPLDLANPTFMILFVVCGEEYIDVMNNAVDVNYDMLFGLFSR